VITKKITRVIREVSIILPRDSFVTFQRLFNPLVPTVAIIMIAAISILCQTRLSRHL